MAVKHIQNSDAICGINAYFLKTFQCDFHIPAMTSSHTTHDQETTSTIMEAWLMEIEEQLKKISIAMEAF